MRSQKRTYATDTAKNATVTVIQRTSCTGISSGAFCEPDLESESNAFVGSVRSAWPLHFSTHFYELSALPGRAELCKVNLQGAPRLHSFFDESCQHAQQKYHRADAQHCQRNSHSITGAPVAANCSRRNCFSARVRGESRVRKEFVRTYKSEFRKFRPESATDQVQQPHSASPGLA
jgi:hypothetical protein